MRADGECNTCILTLPLPFLGKGGVESYWPDFEVLIPISQFTVFKNSSSNLFRTLSVVWWYASHTTSTHSSALPSRCTCCERSIQTHTLRGTVRKMTGRVRPTIQKNVYDTMLRMTSTSAAGTENCSRHTAVTTRKGPLDQNRVGPNNSANTYSPVWLC